MKIGKGVNESGIISKENQHVGLKQFPSKLGNNDSHSKFRNFWLKISHDSRFRPKMPGD